MSENGDEGGSKQQGRRRGNNAEEKELASQQLQIQSKRFYIDVKENQRGRFVKLAEVGVGGRKSRILMTMSAAAEFRIKLNEFSELHSQMGPTHGVTNAGNNNSNDSNRGGDRERGDRDDGLIKSETIIKDRKRYYLDLKENQRGRFLRVSMIMQRGPRAQIAIPAQGLLEFKDHLSDMLERYGTTGSEDTSQQSAGSGGGNTANANSGNTGEQLPESKSLRADNKTFYFDCGSNARGVFLKISEVRQNRYRTSITIPEKYLKEFRQQIDDVLEKTALSSTTTTTTTTSNGTSANGVDGVVGIKSEKTTSSVVSAIKPGETELSKA